MRMGNKSRLARRIIGVPVAVAAVAALLVGCSDSDPEPSAVTDEAASGGTVRVLSSASAFVSLDPQRVYTTLEANVSNLITRTLTTFQTTSDGESKLVGDLAEGTGKPSKDKKTWTFKLREGIKWETGSAITCEDIRYGVLRSFDAVSDEPVITGGSPYPMDWLDVDSKYRGPKADGTGDVGGVTCTNDSTIRFDLRKPIGNFPSATSLTSFAPVPKNNDTWEEYGDDPVSSGPYVLDTYQPADDDDKGSAVFVRNPHFDSKTDDVREAKPDKIVFNFGIDRDYAASQLIADNPEYANAVLFEDVPQTYIQQVLNDDELGARTVSDSGSSVSYLAINSRKVSDVKCRQALRYAFNKRKYMEVSGGELSGMYATTMLAPNDPAHKDHDTYDLADAPQGNLDRAKELLAGNECPTELVLDVADSEESLTKAETIVTTYGRLGITVKTNAIPPEEYYTQISQPDEQHDLAVAGWAPDWPGGSGIMPALFDGDLIKDGINSNFSLLDDTEINERIDEASVEADPDKAHEMWGQLDADISELAVTVPISFNKITVLCGSNIRGASLSPRWDEIDLASLGTADGT